MPKGIYTRLSLEERFHNNIFHSPCGCWYWIGVAANDGYGTIGIDGKILRAHRVSYILHNGEIPKGLLVCHSCDNRLCVNPDHLWLGDHRDNANDMVSKGRGVSPIGETHHNAKINAHDVVSIRHFYQWGLSYSTIARLFHLSRRHITGIVLRKKWKQVL